jgi:CubicO group peptidase (beta-lactamase class C family)
MKSVQVDPIKKRAWVEPGATLGDFDHECQTFWTCNTYRLGYHRVFAVGARVPAGFGHFGFGGSGAWADPVRQLAVALVVNSGVGTPFGDTRIARIGGSAVRCSDRR